MMGHMLGDTRGPRPIPSASAGDAASTAGAATLASRKATMMPPRNEDTAATDSSTITPKNSRSVPTQ